MISRRCAFLCAVAIVFGCAERTESRAVNVAVAANFAGVQAELARRFSEQTGDTVRASVGATGQLYSQIKNGAPFDVFLSADAERPQQLEAESLAVKGSRFTYAFGQLVLYAPRRDSATAPGPELLKSKFEHLAIANPKVAPYGAAAFEVLRNLGRDTALASKVVHGESLTQALQFVKSGAAELGFVAYSQVLKEPVYRYWIVPGTFHKPIVQDAVLLLPGANNAAARAYLDFLRSAEAQNIIRAAGYDVPVQY